MTSDISNRLVVNESKTLTVASAERWNDAEIDVLTSETYSIFSSGTWTDLIYETDFDGFTEPTLDAFNDLKRHPDAEGFYGNNMGSISTTVTRAE